MWSLIDMLTLNQAVYLIVDQDGEVEYDYDGPMFQALSPDSDYIKSCLKYLQEANHPNRSYRIVKAILTEI